MPFTSIRAHAIRRPESCPPRPTTETTGVSGRVEASLFHLARAIPISLVVTVALLAQLPDLPSQEVPSSLSSERVPIRVTQITTEQGLEMGSVYSFEEDRRGFMWMGTQDGLNRYDGRHFKKYKTVPFDSTSLSDSWIWAVHEDEDGMIWLGTQRGGVNRLDPYTEEVRHWKHDPSDAASIAPGSVLAVTTDGEGFVWLAVQGGGLNRLDPRSGTVTRFQHNAANPLSLSNDLVYALHIDENRGLWVSTGNGLCRMHLDRPGRFDRFIFESGDPKRDSPDPSRVLRGIYESPDRPGMLWIGSGAGLVRFDKTTGAYAHFDLDRKDPKQNVIWNAVGDPASPDYLWVTAWGGGAARFHIPTQTFLRYQHDPRDPYSINGDLMSQVVVDRAGMVWMGQYGGTAINLFDPRKVGITTYRHEPENPNSLGGPSVWAAYEDTDGVIWVGSISYNLESYLDRIDRRTGVITRFPNRQGGANGLTGGLAQQILRGLDGSLWVLQSHVPSAGDGSLCRQRPGAISFTCYQHDPHDPTTMGRGGGHTLFMDRDGTIWAGSGLSGLNRFDHATETFTRFAPDRSDPTSLADGGVRSLYRDLAGTLWVGTETALHRMQSDDGRFTRFRYDPSDPSTISSGWVNGIVERPDEPGILWLAMQGSGLDRFDTLTGRATHFTEADGLANSTVYGLLQDDDGTLWMSTNRGVSRFYPETRTFKNYGLHDGLAGLEGNGSALHRGASGQLYIGGSLGLSVINPTLVRDNEVPPAVVLTDFRLFNRSVAVGPDSPLRVPLDQSEEIRLTHSQNNVTFEFVALHFADPARNRYLYQLEGFDGDWIDPGEDRTATYTNLSPGTYTFRVKAANADGVWNDEGAAIRLQVAPPWWRTIWAYGLYVLLVGAGIFGIDRFQRSRLIHKERERARVEQAEIRAAAAEAQSRVLESENERKRNVELLSEIGQQITGTLAVDEIIDTVYARVNELMDATVFGIGIFDETRGVIEFPATREKGQRLPPYLNRLDDSNRVAVRCLVRREEILVSDWATEYNRYIDQAQPPVAGDDASSLIYLPLVYKDRTIGVITAQSFRKNAYSEYHANLLRNLATYAAIAIDNAEAYRRLENTLGNLTATQQQLVTQEKLASLGALTAGIAHEIKNPLNFVNNFADLNHELVEEIRGILPHPPEELLALLSDLENNSAQIAKHGKRADAIIRNMMLHAKGGASRREKVDINELVREHVDLAYHGKRAQQTGFSARVDLSLEPGLPPLEVFPQELGRVLLNLVGNAFDAVVEKAAHAGDGFLPRVAISTSRSEAGVRIEVSDNGPGIPPEIRHRVLEPFFTTKAAGSGTGLGLSLSYDIVTKGHGGTLTIDESGDKGARFTVELPAA